MSYWFLFMVDGRREITAQDLLKKRGFETCVPVELKVRPKRAGRRRDKAEPVEYPVFPSYVWVNCRYEWEWPQVYELSVIRSVVGTCGRPYIFSDKTMDVIRTMTGPKLDKYGQRKGYTIGDHVRVTNGPAFGTVGRVVGIRGQRIRVLLEMLGSERETEIRAGSLEAA